MNTPDGITDYRHNKTGKLYFLIGNATDCTNSRDGTEVVIYFQVGNISRTFVREKSEFLQKFTPIPNDEKNT
jgi:hypothetical protein